MRISASITTGIMRRGPSCSTAWLNSYWQWSRPPSPSPLTLSRYLRVMNTMTHCVCSMPSVMALRGLPVMRSESNHVTTSRHCSPRFTPDTRSWLPSAQLYVRKTIVGGSQVALEPGDSSPAVSPNGGRATWGEEEENTDVNSEAAAASMMARILPTRTSWCALLVTPRPVSASAISSLLEMEKIKPPSRKLSMTMGTYAS